MIKDVDNFIEKEFRGERITKIEEFERPTSRGRYKRLEVNNEDSNTYPALVKDFNSDTMITVGRTIWKNANSKLFTIKAEKEIFEYELIDQRKSRKIELILFLIISTGLFSLLTFVNTIKLR